jgi:hypothetical protein
VEAITSGEYISLVVRLQTDAEGTWFLHIDGADGQQDLPLVPATLVVRLRRSSPAGPLRGSIRLHGSDHWAPIQSNSQLEELVQAWLSSSESGTKPQ